MMVMGGLREDGLGGDELIESWPELDEVGVGMAVRLSLPLAAAVLRAGGRLVNTPSATVGRTESAP